MNEHLQRLANVRAQFNAWEVDAVLIGSPTNRRWLSGFTGSSGQLLVTRETAVLSTDSRYWQQAQREAPHFSLFRDRRLPEDTAEFLRTAAGQRVGLEAAFVTLSEARGLREVNGIEWVELRATLEPLRTRKSERELEAIRAAAAITDAAMAQVNQLAHPGLTERALAWKLEKLMRKAGADGVAFEIIVAAGPNSALPHHRPGSRKLQPGDAIVIDMGASLDGYKSDMTRSFFLGSTPTEQFWNVYNVVLEAQTAVLQNIRVGMSGAQADALARDVIIEAGHGEHFGHGLGHGVGLDIHEEPRLSRLREQETLAAGSVITVEPGIYLPDWGGVRIEDLIYLDGDGIEILSRCPKVPIIPV